MMLLFHFIPSSEICISKADKSVIVYSEKLSYFFTSEEYDLYFFTATNRAILTIQGFISSRKECTGRVWHYNTDVRTSNKTTDVIL